MRKLTLAPGCGSDRYMMGPHGDVMWGLCVPPWDVLRPGMSVSASLAPSEGRLSVQFMSPLGLAGETGLIHFYKLINKLCLSGPHFFDKT